MRKLLTLVVIIMLSASFFACAKKEPLSSLDIKRTNTVQSVAMVERVNLKDRMVTLRSLEGKLFNVHVGEETVNLPQVRRGDRVEISYSETLEIRVAEPGEIKNESGHHMTRAETGSKPGALEVNETIVTAKILELDKIHDSATLKMADGSIARVTVENPENLDKVKVGDTIAIKYLEAIEIQVKGK